jgi:Zn-dependent peptidase ImmA (M78 family)/DNA-binding XRE family transcriptional regulator
MINGSRIRQARELAQLTQAELAGEVGTTQPIIAQIESGRMKPDNELAGALATRLGVPVSFFSRDDPPDFPPGTLLFRSHVTMLASERDKIQRLGQLEFELSMGLTKQVRNKVALRLPQLSDEPTDIVTAAELTRSALGLSLGVPIPHLVKAVEVSGAIVLALPARFKTCDAFSLWVTVSTTQANVAVRRPLIVLSGEAPGDRLRFSLAHELGHLVMHQAIKGTVREYEDEADRFASELLLPAAAMREQLVPPITLTTLAQMKPIWGVSIQAFIRRALDLQVITERQYKYLFQQLGERKWRTEEPIALQVEKPRGMRQMVEIVYGNPISYHRIAHDLDLYPHLVKELISAYATSEEYARRTTKKPEEVSLLFGKNISSP